MKTIRAIAAGILVWVLGVSVFTVSYFVPLMENLDRQANIALVISLIPFAWLGAGIYYRKGSQAPGIKVGTVMVATAIILAGLITVPFMIIPIGGSYFEFFTAASFWIIALEYLLVIILYWRFKVQTSLIESESSIASHSAKDSKNLSFLNNKIMKNSKILVLGGKGKTGRKVAERLTKLNQEVRIGSRTESPSFDWDDPSTWAQALEGMDKVYITFQPDLAVPGALEAIEGLVKEAKRNNIKKLVLLSGKGEKEAELCEQVVVHSGIDYTIVRASWFNQNFSESFFLDPIVAGHVALPKAEAKVPYVDTDDIADVAVAALMDNAHNGQIYELTGPRLLTFENVINEISMATGRDIQFTPISLSAYVKMLKEYQVPSDYIWLINYLFSEVLDNENNSVVKHDIEKVLRRKPKDFSEYVREVAATGIWSPVSETEVVN